MKRFTLLFTLLLMLCATAMAQISTDQMFRLKEVNSNNYFNIWSYNISDEINTYGLVNIVAGNQVDQQIFYFEESGDDNVYYLKSKSGYYVKCGSTERYWNLVVTENKEEATPLKFVETSDGEYRIINTTLSKYLKVEEAQETDTGVKYVYCDAVESSAATWLLEEFSYYVEVGKTTGTLSGGNSNWRGTWTSNSEPQLLFYVSDKSNNITTKDGFFEIWVGQANSKECIYTLEISDGYVITGYEFDFINDNDIRDGGTRKVTVRVPGVEPIIANNENQTVRAEGINASFTDFKIDGKDSSEGATANNGIQLSNFKVYYEKDNSVSDVEYAVNNMLKVSDAPKNGFWANNTTWYIIQNNQNGYMSSSNKTTEEYLTLGNNTKPSNYYGLWCVVGNDADGYMFYNRAQGADAVLQGTRVRGKTDAAAVKFTSDNINKNNPNIFFDIEPSNVVGHLIVKDHATNSDYENYWNKRSNNVAYWDSSNAVNGPGSAFAFVNADDFEVLLSEAQELVSKTNYSVNSKLPLQVGTSTAPYYLMSNADQNVVGNSKDGNGIGALIDGEYNDPSYMHTQWSGTSVGEAHYIQVDLGEGNSIGEFKFTYHTRNNEWGSHPYKMTVTGYAQSLTDEPVKIADLEGLTNSANVDVTRIIGHDSLQCRYIRFTVTDSRGSYGGFYYFSMSEFSMYRLEPAIDEEYSNDMSLIQELYNTMNSVTSGSHAKDIVQAMYNMNNKIHQFNSVTTVESGKFYVIESAHSGYAKGSLLYANLSSYDTKDDGVINKPNTILWNKDVSGANTIWQFEEAANGYYLKNVHNAEYVNKYNYPALMSKNEPALITLNNLGEHQVNIQIGGSKMHAQERWTHIVSYDGGLNSPSAWYIREVEAPVHYLNVSSAGWATLILGYDAVIPQDVTCYVVNSITADAVNLTKVEDILPANTAVIVEAAEGKYPFAYSVTPAVNVESKLQGALYDKVITENAYVLGNLNGIGLYRAALDVSSTDGTELDSFITYANKAYLPASLVPTNVQGSNSFSFRFDEGVTTPVERVETENSENVIYTISGVRVNSLSAPGLYIVNGQLVLVK